MDKTEISHDMDHEKIYTAMEKGHKIKLLLMKKCEPTHKWLSLNRETRQIVLSKFDATQGREMKPQHMDIRLIHEVHTVHYEIHELKLGDKWKKNKELKRFDPECLLAISYGAKFVLDYWVFLFEDKESCQLWHQGLNHIKYENEHSSHAVLVDKWIKKQFYSIACPESFTVTIQQMKPFVQTTLQYKVTSSILQEISEGELDLKMFVEAYRRLLNPSELAVARFSRYLSNNDRLSFNDFHRFMIECQGDEIAQNREEFSEFLRRYLREYDLTRDVPEPWVSVDEFIDYLYSNENSIFDPENSKVVQDMTRPLAHYWIASSHNTFLTGNQLRSDSSLDAYSRALLMGCRCIELECWDEKGSNDDIVIYHGYTMTSKLKLRDVLHTIKHYAFINNDYPVILSIGDNCSVPAQRLMAQEIKEILGDLLLTVPVSRYETQLPSPSSLRKRIILKHKKLRPEGANIDMDEDPQEQTILQKACNKRGVLYLRDNTKQNWIKHVFVLLSDRLCYMVDAIDPDILKEQKEDSISQVDDEIQGDENSLADFGVQPEEMHVTEEWFHGKNDQKTDFGNENGTQFITIFLAGALIEKYDSDRPFAFRIAQASANWSVQEHILAADNVEEMQDWVNTLLALTREANKKMLYLWDMENRERIAELSALVVYCQKVPFNPNFLTEGKFMEMTSFSENKHEKLLEKGLILYNARQLSRVYPQASRLTSTNFNPMPMWNSGCHMVALNYQTGDRSMQLNQGKFLANGRCGYVLKPSYLLDETFKPNDPDSICGSCPIHLRVEVIAGRNLARKDRTKKICSPFVKIEVVGLPCDSIVYRTDTETSNGLNPRWEQSFEFTVRAPEMALLRFLVKDGDFVGPKTDPFIGQAVFPLDSIRGGFRSVPLLNQFSEPIELSALLVNIDIR